MAKSRPYWNVHPRYSPGSPAALWDERQVERIVDSEKQGHEAALEGIYGPELKARAERLGLRGIVVLTHEKGKKWVCYDEVTEEHYERPFDDRMRKDGFVRFTDLDPHIQEMVTDVEPVIVTEAQKDERPFWFRVPVLREFWNPQGGWDDPLKPNEPLLWEPTIKPTTTVQG